MVLGQYQQLFWPCSEREGSAAPADSAAVLRCARLTGPFSAQGAGAEGYLFGFPHS